MNAIEPRSNHDRTTTVTDTTKETTNEVVSDKAVTGLTMESLKATKARGILGALDHKTKVNTDALTTHGSAAGRIQTAREVAKFSACANRTALKIVSKRYVESQKLLKEYFKLLKDVNGMMEQETKGKETLKLLQAIEQSG